MTARGEKGRDVHVNAFKRACLCVVATLVAGLALAACGSSTNAPGKLTIGGWGATIDRATQTDYLDPFKADGGASAQFVDAPGTQLARIEAQSKSGKIEWDLLDSVGGDTAYTLAKNGRLAPVPADMKARWEQTLGAGKVTDFGFSHANVGNVIVCNTDKVKACPKTMADFYDVARFPGRRMFAGTGPIMAIATAQAAMGLSRDAIANAPVDMDAVFGKLGELKPAIKVFWTSGDQQEQVLRSGEVDMGVMWSGRAYALKQQGMNLEVNWDGGAYEPSFWAVVKGGPNQSRAFELMDWIVNHPQQQAKWAESVRYSVPNPRALDFLPSSIGQELADSPANFDQLVVPNFAWYADHAREVNSRYENFVRG